MPPVATGTDWIARGGDPGDFLSRGIARKEKVSLMLHRSNKTSESDVTFYSSRGLLPHFARPALSVSRVSLSCIHELEFVFCQAL